MDESIKVECELLKALVKAKQSFKPLIKNRSNPFFSSRYADLQQIHDAIDTSLKDNGLLVMQPTVLEGSSFGVKTKLVHLESAKSIDSFYLLPTGLDPQKMAAAVTYARRISLASLLCLVADDDDDGNSTSAPKIAPDAKKSMANLATPKAPIAAPKAIAAKPAQPTPTPAPPAADIIQGQCAGIKKVQGKGAKGDWSRYDIKVKSADGKFVDMSTFDAALAEKIVGYAEELIDIQFHKGVYGLSIDSVCIHK